VLVNKDGKVEAFIVAVGGFQIRRLRELNVRCEEWTRHRVYITPRRRHGLFHPTAVEAALVGFVLLDVRSLSLLGNILRFWMLD
jgi:hypothetical protein